MPHRVPIFLWNRVPDSSMASAGFSDATPSFRRVDDNSFGFSPRLARFTQLGPPFICGKGIPTSLTLCVAGTYIRTISICDFGISIAHISQKTCREKGQWDQGIASFGGIDGPTGN